jgi:hypothetical protein
MMANNPLWSRAQGGLDQDPAQLLVEALHRAEAVQDYRCTFIKQERVGDTLKPRQTLDVLYRERPQSICLRWVENPEEIRAAVWVQGRNVSEQGDELIVVEPSGFLARALAGQVSVPLHGKEAREASRYTLDQYGFRPILARIVAENERFAATGALTWSDVREGTINERPTFVIVRRLPADPSEGYPNALLIVHLDREWLLPVAIRAYADANGRELLEHYTCLGLQLNPGLGEEDFKL